MGLADGSDHNYIQPALNPFSSQEIHFLRKKVYQERLLGVVNIYLADLIDDPSGK